MEERKGCAALELRLRWSRIEGSREGPLVELIERRKKPVQEESRPRRKERRKPPFTAIHSVGYLRRRKPRKN